MREGKKKKKSSTSSKNSLCCQRSCPCWETNQSEPSAIIHASAWIWTLITQISLKHNMIFKGLTNPREADVVKTYCKLSTLWVIQLQLFHVPNIAKRKSHFRNKKNKKHTQQSDQMCKCDKTLKSSLCTVWQKMSSTWTLKLKRHRLTFWTDKEPRRSAHHRGDIKGDVHLFTFPHPQWNQSLRVNCITTELIRIRNTQGHLRYKDNCCLVSARFVKSILQKEKNTNVGN